MNPYIWKAICCFKIQKNILIAEETTSAGRCSFFNAVSSCSMPICLYDSAAYFFYYLEGINAYESETHLPRLRDALGL